MLAGDAAVGAAAGTASEGAAATEAGGGVILCFDARVPPREALVAPLVVHEGGRVWAVVRTSPRGCWFYITTFGRLC